MTPSAWTRLGSLRRGLTGKLLKLQLSLGGFRSLSRRTIARTLSGNVCHVYRQNYTGNRAYPHICKMKLSLGEVRYCKS